MDRAWSLMRRCLGSAAGLYRTALMRLLHDDGLGLSAQMAYHALFSVFPGILVLSTLAQFLGLRPADLTKDLVELAQQHLPPSTVELLENNLPGLIPEAGTGTITLGTVLLVWVASNFLNTVLKALSVAYRLPRMRHFFTRRLMALGLVVLFGLASAVSFNLLVFGRRHIREFVEVTFGLGESLSAWISILRWTATPVAMVLSTMLLYAIVPTKRLRLAVVWPGAVTFTLLWLLATGLFTAYVGKAAFGQLHGAIAHIIVLMMWFYISCLLLLYGAEVNAVWFRLRHFEEDDPEITLG